MKYLTTQPVTAIAIMFGFIVVSAVMLWPAFEVEIKNALRTAQAILFWWQQ